MPTVYGADTADAASAMLTVHEVSARSGVSVRTLHYYDAIGLLRPSAVTAAGYRLYDGAALRRLQSILLFRELGFALKEIARMLQAPDFDMQEALAQQIRGLELQRDRLDALLALARQLQTQGGNTMDFTAFDTDTQRQYAEEVKARWQHTAAYAQHQQKDAHKTDAQRATEAAGLMQLLAELAALRPLPAVAEAVQQKVAALQSYISAHYYTCTDEILAGLGQMYTADERMRENIDRAAGQGAAAFAGEAIAAYTQARQAR